MVYVDDLKVDGHVSKKSEIKTVIPDRLKSIHKF